MAFDSSNENASASDLQKGQLDPRSLASHHASWGIGPLKIEAIVDLSVPNAATTAYLFGQKIGECELDAGNCCNIGGSVGEAKAEAKICLNTNPLRIVIDAKLRATISGSKKYHVEIPIPLAEVEEGEEEQAGSLKWV
jgi:hypothetical protein